MRFILVALALIVFMPGCSMMNPLSMFTKKPSIEVNANIGKNVNQDKSMIKVETGTSNQTADQISNDTAYKADTINQITNSLTPLELLIIVIMAGAALPSFKEMYVGLKVVTGDILRTAVVYPCTAISKFVLVLFGRDGKRRVPTIHDKDK